jgi:hypothetical protein
MEQIRYSATHYPPQLSTLCQIADKAERRRAFDEHDAWERWMLMEHYGMEQIRFPLQHRAFADYARRLFDRGLTTSFLDEFIPDYRFWFEPLTTPVAQFVYEQVFTYPLYHTLLFPSWVDPTTGRLLLGNRLAKYLKGGFCDLDRAFERYWNEVLVADLPVERAYDYCETWIEQGHI